MDTDYLVSPQFDILVIFSPLKLHIALKAILHIDIPLFSLWITKDLMFSDRYGWMDYMYLVYASRVLMMQWTDQGMQWSPEVLWVHDWDTPKCVHQMRASFWQSRGELRGLQLQYVSTFHTHTQTWHILLSSTTTYSVFILCFNRCLTFHLLPLTLIITINYKWWLSLCLKCNNVRWSIFKLPAGMLGGDKHFLKRKYHFAFGFVFPCWISI